MSMAQAIESLIFSEDPPFIPATLRGRVSSGKTYHMAFLSKT